MDSNQRYISTVVFAVTLTESVANSCSLSVPIAVSVVVLIFLSALMFVAGLFAGLCFSKRRFKTGQFPPSSAEEAENSSKAAAAVYEEVDLHQLKPTDIQLTENAAYGEFKI